MDAMRMSALALMLQALSSCMLGTDLKWVQIGFRGRKPKLWDRALLPPSLSGGQVVSKYKALILSLFERVEFDLILVYVD